jgi:hypothetical protein
VLVGDATQPALIHLIEERGAGGWAWPDRFGQAALPARGDAGLKVLHTFDGNPYPLPVRSPVFEFPERLAAGAEWTDGRDQYICQRTRDVQGRTVWVVDVSLDRGRRQTLNVDAATGLLVSLEERLFLGRGDPFQMKLTLESQRMMSADELTKFTTPATALLDLQRDLNRTGQARQVDLSTEQVQRATVALAAIRPQALGTVWVKFLDVVERDLAQQSRQQAGVAGLEQKFVGQPATLTDLKLAVGGPLLRTDLEGHTTVLHFWDYNGEKLVEPYGQVGYLDFLHNRRGKLGAKVIGVAVDARLSDPAQTVAATRGIRKLRDFMNLGFPITRWGSTPSVPMRGCANSTPPSWKPCKKRKRRSESERTSSPSQAVTLRFPPTPPISSPPPGRPPLRPPRLFASRPANAIAASMASGLESSSSLQRFCRADAIISASRISADEKPSISCVNCCIRSVAAPVSEALVSPCSGPFNPPFRPRPLRPRPPSPAGAAAPSPPTPEIMGRVL